MNHIWTLRCDSRRYKDMSLKRCTLLNHRRSLSAFYGPSFFHSMRADLWVANHHQMGSGTSATGVSGCLCLANIDFDQNNRPAKWRWCLVFQYCRKLWWSSYIETAAEMLPKDGSSKVAWPLQPCNFCLFFNRRRATMKIEGFIMVPCYLGQPANNPTSHPSDAISQLLRLVNRRIMRVISLRSTACLCIIRPLSKFGAILGQNGP